MKFDFLPRPTRISPIPLSRLLSALLLAVLLAGAAPGRANDLTALRASGAIGERHDGYAQARSDNAKAIANAVNAKRRAVYQQKAAERGVSAGQVAQIYAGEIYKKLPAGTWYLQSNGKWVRK